MDRHLLSERFEFVPGRTPTEMSGKQREMLTEFIRRLEHGAYRVRDENCPCGSKPRDTVISEVDRYGLPLQSVLCETCGTVRINPYLDTNSLENFYSELYQDLYGRALEPDAYFERQRAYGKKIRGTTFGMELGGERTVLEIGCGAGGGLFEFQKCGFRSVGCDFSERLVRYGTERGVERLLVGGISEVRQRFPADRFDFIFLHHVYEHVSEPIGLLQEIQSVLAPGGKVFIIVPDLSRIDRFPNPAGDALDFFHVAHKYNYSVPGLQAAANQAGFTGRSVTPPAAMRTAWSRSPEIWLELQTGNDCASIRGEQHGPVLLEHLLKIEQKYRWGLCPAQISETVRFWRPDRMVSRWVRRLKGRAAA